MFLGHFGLGFGAKRFAPAVSLGALFLAAQFVDLLWPTFLLLGVETVAIEPGITVVTPLDFVSYPISHSLLAAFIWGALFGAGYQVLRKYPRGAWALGGLVVSHWYLDWFMHRPDLPLLPGGSRLVGLGMWNSLPLTLVLELGFLALGLWSYLRATRAVDRVGTVALWSLVGFLLVVYAANLLGEPPPSVVALAWVGQAQWLLVAWGYWIDAHRARDVMST